MGGVELNPHCGQEREKEENGQRVGEGEQEYPGGVLNRGAGGAAISPYPLERIAEEYE